MGLRKKIIKYKKKRKIAKKAKKITKDAIMFLVSELDKRSVDAHFRRLFFSQVDAHLKDILAIYPASKAQLKQDIFVCCELGFKREGYFVEFGATDGLGLSNTYLLEKDLAWQGILSEPARCWHEALKKNRSAFIEKKCVWNKSGEKLLFSETRCAELSTIKQFASNDSHKDHRKNAHNYEVETISLMDLLDKYNAPRNIDYLSLDTEGSEWEILRAFDFKAYNVKIITCEHNYTENREKVHSLLTANGYYRKHYDASCFDDWYVKSD